MKYLECIIKESLRMYPPVPFIARQISQEVTIGWFDSCLFKLQDLNTQTYISDNINYPPGTIFNIHIFDLHRDSKQFPSPEKFDPDRFLPDVTSQRHAYAFIPFSAGPRNCLAQKYAMLEIKTALSQIIRKFRILPVTKLVDIRFICNLVLKTENPVLVRFELR